MPIERRNQQNMGLVTDIRGHRYAPNGELWNRWVRIGRRASYMSANFLTHVNTSPHGGLQNY